MLSVVTLVLSLVSGGQTGQTAASRFTLQADAARAVEQMRGISMVRRAIAPGDGRIDLQEQRRAEITDHLHTLGAEAIAALARTSALESFNASRNAGRASAAPGPMLPKVIRRDPPSGI